MQTAYRYLVFNFVFALIFCNSVAAQESVSTEKLHGATWVITTQKVPDLENSDWEFQNTSTQPFTRGLINPLGGLMYTLVLSLEMDSYVNERLKIEAEVYWKKHVDGSRENIFMIFGDDRISKWAIAGEDGWHVAKEVYQEENLATSLQPKLIQFSFKEDGDYSMMLIFRMDTFDGWKQVSFKIE